MKKLIIHIGYPKTATSTLQLNVFTRLMKENKIEYLNHLGNDELLGKISVKKIMNYILGLNEEIDYFDELEKLKDITIPATLLSSESIAHVCKESPKASYKIGAVNNAQKIKKIFSPFFDTIKIIMVIRAQKTIIPSYYAQEYFNIIGDNPKFKNFELWFDANFGKKIRDDDLIFNYNIMYKAYADIFGEKNVNVLLYEDLIHDKYNFYQRMANILGTDIQTFQKYFEVKAVNRSQKSKDGKLLLRKYSLRDILYVIYSPLKKRLPNELASKIKIFTERIVPDSIWNLEIGNQSAVHQLSPNQLETTKNRFNHSNELLFNKLGFDKEKVVSYGYFL